MEEDIVLHLPNSDNKYVAFLDILGFSELISQNTLEEVENIFHSTIEKALNETRAEFRDHYITHNSKSNMNISCISDSIIVWTNDDSPESLAEILAGVWLMSGIFMTGGLPLRGGISKGPLAVKRHDFGMTLLGRGLIKAHAIEKGQNWSGVVLDKDCLHEFGKNNMIHDYEEVVKNFKKSNCLVQYKVPHKNGPVIDQWCINWASIPEMGITEADIKESFEKYNKKVDTWDVMTKLDNTLKFYDAMKQFPYRDPLAP